MSPTVLIMDANQRSALAATRSLGRLGYQVITADCEDQTLAGSSRHSTRHLVYPNPYESPLEFLKWVERALQPDQVQIVLPMTEVTTDLLIRHRERWPEVTLPFPDIKTIDALSNKITLHRRAEQLGIPIPATRYFDSPSTLLEEADELTYPLVLKPYRSRILLGDQWLCTSVVIAHSPTELRSALNSPTFVQHPFMAQACVVGEGQGIFALYDKGQPVTFFSHRRIRERPPWGGVSVLSESIQPDAKLISIARQLLDDVNWHGVAMVEFKVATDGTPYLMEINTRFWGSLQLAIDAGIDFPALLLKIAQGQSVPQPTVTTGKRLRWLMGDLDHLYLTWKSSRYSLWEKLRTSITLLKPDLTGLTRHEVNRLDDMAPAWHELKQYLRLGNS